MLIKLASYHVLFLGPIFNLQFNQLKKLLTIFCNIFNNTLDTIKATTTFNYRHSLMCACNRYTQWVSISYNVPTNNKYTKMNDIVWNTFASFSVIRK
jgi:hypothetical protein